jgi:predicted HD superfamily hydrolase involved in NAD metabolism
VGLNIYTAFAEKLSPIVADSLSKSRYLHSLRVARYAKALAQHYGCSSSKAYLAGLLHDLAREWPESEMLRVALFDGQGMSDFELSLPLLLHGRAAAWVLEHTYAITALDVLEAVRHHTLGKHGMGNIAKIVFCADYLEPGRKYMSQSFRRSTHVLSLNDLLCACVQHAQDRGKMPALQTLELVESLRKK